MFKNPLKKYQQGGQMSTEEAENQMAQALAEAFQMDPQVVKARIQEIRQNPEESKLFAQGLQMLQQGDQQNGMAIIERLFQVPSRKQGGKINSFICKHAKGGHVAGCGCKEDGGKVTKAQKGESLEDSAPEYLYNENGVPSEFNRYISRPGRMLYAEVPTPRGNINFEFNQLNRTVPGGLNLPVEYDVQTRSMLDDPERSMGIQRLPLYQMPYFSKLKKQGAQYEENGGVVKGQNSIPGGMPGPEGISSSIPNLNAIIPNKSKGFRKHITHFGGWGLTPLLEQFGQINKYNAEGNIISIGPYIHDGHSVNAEDMANVLKTNFSRTDTYDPSMITGEPIMYRRTVTYKPGNQTDTTMQKSILGLLPYQNIEKGSKDWNKVNSAEKEGKLKKGKKYIQE